MGCAPIFFKRLLQFQKMLAYFAGGDSWSTFYFFTKPAKFAT